MPTLSLCMIARDEARFLPACLASVRGVVDQIVLVDTGSRDDTVRIARDADAEVLEHPWSDDFAAARNAGLERARGSHVLVLDADEVLLQGTARALHEACSRRDLGVGLLPLHNATELDATPRDVVSGAARMGLPVHLPRLFPNSPSLRYRGRIHEVLFPDFDWLQRHVGGRPYWVEASVVHYGEVPALRAARHKGQRNVRLMERALRDEPADHLLAGYLAGEYYLADRFDDAEALCRRHLPELLAQIDRLPPERERPCPVRLAGVLGLCLLRAGDPRGARETARSALRRARTPHPNLLYVEGRACEALGTYRAAEESYRRCLEAGDARFGTPVFRGVTGHEGRLRMASCALAQGAAERALEWLPRARGPAAVACSLLRAEAYLLQGEPQEALRWLTPLRRLAQPPADAFALAHRALAALGQVAPELLRAAAESPPERWIEERRRPSAAGRVAAESVAAAGRVGDEGLEPPTSSL